MKTKEKFKTTIRCTEETKKEYEKYFSSFYKGAEIGAEMYPYLRKYALERVKEEILEHDFKELNQVTPESYLKEHLMIDPVVMIRAIDKLSQDIEELKTKIGDLHPIHIYFIFTEIRRFRDIKEDVPSYTEEEFFNEEMK